MKKRRLFLFDGIIFALALSCLNLTAKSECTKAITNINSVNIALFVSGVIVTTFVVANCRHLKLRSFAGLSKKTHSKVVILTYGASNGAKKKDENCPDVAEDASSPSEMQKQVERGKAPKEVNRVDNAHGSSKQPHVHFKDGTALNRDGSIYYND